MRSTLIPALLDFLTSTWLVVCAAAAAAAAAAAPPPPASRAKYATRSKQTEPKTTTTHPSSSDEFSLSMTVNGTSVSLTATSNGTAELVLQAGRLSVYPGTPTYLNTTGTSTGGGSVGFDSSLVFDLSNSTAVTPGMYGIAVPDLGELYGVSSNVVAIKDYQEFEFEVADGGVYHQLTSASQSWFACLDTSVDDGTTPNYFLKWGVFTEGGAAPAGCSVTSVVQNFNVPGTSATG